VNTEDWLGLLCVDLAPWVWWSDLDSHLYLRESCATTGEGWMFAKDLGCIQLSILSTGNTIFGWSHKLARWFYIPEMTMGKEEGWIYMLQ